MNSPVEIIRASEIGRYVFCSRAWWLSTVLGYRSLNEAVLAEGVQDHNRHGRLVAASQRWRKIGLVLLIIAAALGVIILARWMGGEL